MIQIKKYFLNPHRIAVIVTKSFPLQKVRKNARVATTVKYHDDAGGLPGAGVFPCNRGKGSIFTNGRSLQIISTGHQFNFFPRNFSICVSNSHASTWFKLYLFALSKYFMLFVKVNAKTIHGCDLQRTTPWCSAIRRSGTSASKSTPVRTRIPFAFSPNWHLLVCVLCFHRLIGAKQVW